MGKLHAFISIAILGLLAGCSQEQPDTPEQELVKTVNVETTRVEPQLFESYLRMVGTVEAQNDVRVSAEVSGRINQYYVEKGDLVQKGEAIAKIDDSQLIREKQRLEAVTAQSRENYERLKRLFEQENVGSEIDYLNARYTYEQNQAALESVNVNLDKTTVRAPFNASVENILVEEGEMASPGTALVRLIGSDRMKVAAGVPARYASDVNKGDSAQVWFDFQQSDTLQLPLTFVGQSISPQNRTFRIEMALPSSESRFKIDMIANVKVKTSHRKSTIVVGKEFIYQKEDGFVVYTAVQDKKGNTIAREQPVKLGPSYENNTVVVQGLEPGEVMITVGSSFLQDGMRINIVDAVKNELAKQK